MLAFISHTAFLPHAPLHKSHNACGLHAPRPSSLRMTTTPPPQYDEGVDIEVIKEKAIEVVDDVKGRPLYYGKIVGFAVVGIVTFTVMKAVVSAVDSIPLLPGGLELIGLGYTAWFIWRYVLFKESREELLEEIEDFLGRAKPGGPQ